jgi:hypothetical protein
MIDLSDNEMIDLSDNESENTSENIEKCNSDNASEETRLPENIYEYYRTLRKQIDRKQERKKKKINDTFIKKQIVSSIMCGQKLTYEDIVESFIYHNK